MILVTGGAGYIGSHCVLNLLAQGFDVVVFDNLELGHIETIETLQKLSLKGKLKDFIKGDLKNSKDIDAVFEKHKIEAALHFAAYSQVSESMKKPQKYFENNIGGSKNLFAAMAKNGVDKVIFSSTAATYGNPEYIPIDEKHPQSPINPYGESKLQVEKILDEYDAKNLIKSVRLRYFNVVGADSQSRIGEWHEPETHLVPNILKASFGKVFELYGTNYDTKDGTCVRDYINVEDLAEAHFLALKYLLAGGSTCFLNAGTREGNSVKEIFDMCENVLQQKVNVKISPRRAGDPAVLVADNLKITKVLNWQPQRTLEDSIRSAKAWEDLLPQKSLTKQDN